MPTLIFTHADCLAHDTGPGHPERTARLTRVLELLNEEDFTPLVRHDAPEATRAQLEYVHAPDYVDRVFAAVPETGYAALDADTVVSPGSGRAALRAAGAVCAAVDAVCGGPDTRAFCPVRPPGHHAERGAAMGFCLFNNIAIGAQHGRHAHGLARVAIVDFDVHHGNGTAAAFHDDPGLFYASVHQMPLYPGTGAPDDTGVAGNIVNMPLAPGTGGPELRRAFDDIILPALDRFKPELMLVSAGFDGHRDDPLAQLNLMAEDYGWASRQLVDLATRHCHGRLVSVLEGGYNLDALADSVAAHLRALMAA